ncbi:type II secretion system minor pseudopilin [Marinobacterium lutimaris]|uniref:General secretion pathway protein K n=1 Tax=Marinobacterium lutimaris TaxID=568106 RepID=A0A1H5X085_9GAMM|nr:type II secretion system protein GspK [Marinobacterium lutimaris]SEG04885.1 general secretion pathway protein K [Marinobacterium lutimaris]
MAYVQTSQLSPQQLVADQGVVLVTVLWVLLLLSLIATNLSLSGRGFARQTQNTEQGVQAAQAADGGLNWVVWNLQQGRGWLADGSEHQLLLGKAALSVALYDESGKLDLNAAPSELLDALLEPAIVDNGQRAALVAAIEDWRDADDLVRLNGAEEADYLAAGRERGPANAPFNRVVELLQVLGMDLSIYQQVSPNLTVMTRSQTINPQVASFEVLMTLPNASESVVRAYIDNRRLAWDNELDLPELPFNADPYVSVAQTGRFYTSITRAVISPTTDLKRVVLITRGGQSPKMEPVDTLLELEIAQLLNRENRYEQ